LFFLHKPRSAHKFCEERSVLQLLPEGGATVGKVLIVLRLFHSGRFTKLAAVLDCDPDHPHNALPSLEPNFTGRLAPENNWGIISK
jgi:hypothetical protein